MARDLNRYLRPGVSTTPFCPGCGHGILMNIILRAIDELRLNLDDMLFVSGIGCAAWIPSPNFNADTLHTLHGRAIAFATGAKAFNPQLKTMVISGDGDLASIGGNHLIHAARRDTDLTVICANNMIYGMTGGQAAPTTPAGAISATTGGGNPWAPFDLCRLVIGAGAGYAARFAVTQPLELKEAIKEVLGFTGFGFIEVLSPCPTQYGRRNDYGAVTDMLEDLRRRCVTADEMKRLTGTERKDRILTGVLHDERNERNEMETARA
ncbi:MAG: 2-oxoglutarate synthase [Deltaproteobacteria bacterium]|nr:2-oxoglutarate synthase [Candidatus Anaeroferrophillacea bacterium]